MLWSANGKAKMTEALEDSEKPKDQGCSWGKACPGYIHSSKELQSRSNDGTPEQVKHFFCCHFVEHKCATSNKYIDVDKVKKEGEDKADSYDQRLISCDSFQKENAMLKDQWMEELKSKCKEHKLDLKTTKHYFIAGAGKPNEYFTLQHEFYYRWELTSKKSTNRITADDPMLPALERGTNIPEHDFVCSPEIAWARFHCKSDAFLYTTKKSRNGTTEITWGREKDVPWKPIPKDVFDKLGSVIKLYEKYEKHTKFQLKPAREAVKNLRSDIYLKWIGRRRARAPETPRLSVKKSKTEEGVAPAKMAQHAIRREKTLSPASADPAAKSPRLREEFQSIYEMWSKLATLAWECGYRASRDCWSRVVDQLAESAAMVFRCDFAYEPPNGRRFRTVGEKVSWADDALVQMLRIQNFTEDDGKLESLGDNRWQRRYKAQELVATIFPYAAVFDSSDCLVELDVDVLHSYYENVYTNVKNLLDEWHLSLESDNGGFLFPEADAARRVMIPDDKVFGGGVGYSLHEMPPGLLSELPLPPFTQHIVRRLRYGEVGDDGGTLPETICTLVREYNFGSGWMLWTDQKWWKKNTHRQWEVMPVDNDGLIRPLGWVESDDAPEEEQEYYLDMKAGMMPDVLPRLPRMFG